VASQPHRIGCDFIGLEISIMTFTIAISAAPAPSPDAEHDAQQIWNANNVAGGMSSAWRWMIGARM